MTKQNALTAPIIAGLAVGIAFVTMFSIAASYSMSITIPIYVSRSSLTALPSQWNVPVTHVNSEELNKMPLLKTLVERAEDSVTFFSSGYSGEITRKEAEQLQQFIQFVRVPSMSEVEVLTAMVQIDGEPECVIAIRLAGELPGL
jgi:hypothetical protein